MDFMKSIRRVLIVQPYGIGDLLFLTPVFRALRLIPTVEKIDLLLGSRTEAVVKNNPHVDEIFQIDKDLFHRRSRNENLKEIFALGWRLRKNRYDLLLDYSIRSECAVFGRTFLGIPHAAGFAYKKRAIFHTHRYPLPEGFSARHVVDFDCDLAELAGIKVEDRFLEFFISEDDRKELKVYNTKESYLVVSPGGGESWGKDAHFKRWPAKYFSDFILQLKARLDFERVFVMGSAGEKELAAEIIKSLPLPATDLTGRLSLGAAAALLEGALLFIGNDGGLVHLARALGTPLAAFYGPVDPAVYGPYPASPRAAVIYKKDLECRPCYQKFRYKSDCPHRDCLQALSPEEAIDQLVKMEFFNSFLSTGLPRASF